MADFIDKLEESDEALVEELYQRALLVKGTEVAGQHYRNSELASWVIGGGKPDVLAAKLKQRGMFDLNTEQVLWLDGDGEQRKLWVNRASKTHMWPMGTNYWVRDNALIGARLMALDKESDWYQEEWFELGRQLLLSAITVMSSCRQLERFELIISGASDPSDPHLWPHIFLEIETNLNAANDEEWMHQQDAWQIACYYLLDALERGWIDSGELTEKHKRMLSYIVPFLHAVDFSQRENGGSWEEIAAVRSSVLCWELSLLHKLESVEWLKVSEDMLGLLIEQAACRLKKSLPHESPSYNRNDIRYREEDSALIYALMLDLFPLVDRENHHQLREATIASVESLVGEHGAMRYRGDSYQGLSYYTNKVSGMLSELYDSPSGDSSGHEEFRRRGEIVPAGYEAQWTHFIWQLSSVFGQLYRRYGVEEYAHKQEFYWNKGLSLITGEGEASLQQVNGKMEVFRLPAFRLPECYNSELHKEEVFVYPSLHTPLYWSVAECLAAFSEMQARESELIYAG